EMYLAGQCQKEMFVAATSDPGERGTPEQIKAFRELKRRKELLKEKEKAVRSEPDQEDEDVEILTEHVEPKVKLEPPESQGEAASSSSKPKFLVKSKYPEDVTVRGHGQIWGSWYTIEEK
ncbi:unnamed protein product, partial [Symbiodinium pilosum]